MPERSVTVVSYAAGASLAAAALIYVFGPTFTIDHDSGSSRKKTIVGLRNQANDCFINSVLQVLAGLGDLRVYLIRETYRRHIEDPTVYQNLIQPQAGVKLEDWKLRGLQEGLVTKGLKDMLDALNERPIARKSISPFPLVKVLETAFKQRISRQQQDAQEFMQIVAERLEDEYRAGLRARDHARRRGLLPPSTAGADNDSASADPAQAGKAAEAVPREGRGAEGPPSVRVEEASGAFDPESAGFPLEGRYEFQLTCQTCGYKTKSRQESFCTLTLAVPHVSSTSLNACFDSVFKTEYIDDFKCAMCRLRYAKAALERELSMSTLDTFREQAGTKMNKISAMMETDPEKMAEEMAPDDFGQAPWRRIAKTTRMTVFPKVLVIHLSRSIYGGQTTQKNSAKVTFPEQLPLGGLADQHQYKLVGIITHRGGHNSGHYEAFRRQNEPCPYHNTNTFQPSNVYSKTSTPVSTPRIQDQAGSPVISTSDLLAPTAMTNTPRPSLDSAAAAVRSAALPGTAQAGNGPWSPGKSKAHPALARRPRKRKPGPDRWWRVSDEKVREAKTSEVLGMQQEVYLLFYELER